MSKSKRNVVAPDTFVEQYGSNILRMYLMFMGPFSDGGDWSDTGITGIQRFVDKIYKLYEKHDTSTSASPDTLHTIHKAIKKVGEDIEKLSFNTAISCLMETSNVLLKQDTIDTETLEIFSILLSPLAPHLSEEIRSTLGKTDSIFNQSWPEYIPMFLQSSTQTIAVQVNGKLR